MSDPKEPAFFVPEHRWHPKDEGWYLSLFEGPANATVFGESSTQYTKLPLHSGVAERIAAYCPGARLIYVMRDPVERAVSHYWYRVQRLEESRGILRALKEDREYVNVSRYSMQLEPYFRHFQRDRILPIVFEETLADPERILAQVLAFLDLESCIPLDLPRSNIRPAEFEGIRGRGILRKVSESRTWDRLAPAVPKRLRTFASALTVGPTTIDRAAVAEAEDFLRPLMQQEVRTLSQLLGRSFSAWKTTLDSGEGVGTQDDRGDVSS